MRMCKRGVPVLGSLGMVVSQDAPEQGVTGGYMIGIQANTSRFLNPANVSLKNSYLGKQLLADC